jgi:hypothetical protein
MNDGIGEHWATNAEATSSSCCSLNSALEQLLDNNLTADDIVQISHSEPAN